MTIPVWPLVLLGIFFYLLIGVAQALWWAFRQGREGQSGVGSLEGFMIAVLWPFVNFVVVIVWVTDKYDRLLEVARKRGAQSAEKPGDRPDGL